MSLFKRAATIAGVMLVFAVSAPTQGPVITTGAPNPKISNGAPAGTCGPQDTDIDSSTGNWYVCKSGAWTLAGSGGGGGSGTVSGQANGVVPLATGATTIGAQSHISDNAALVTISLPVTISTGALTLGSGASSAGAGATNGFACTDSGATGWTPTAGQSYIRCATSVNGWVVSQNGTPEVGLISTAYATARDAKSDDSGTNQVQRATLDCQLGVKCSDDSTNTRTDIRQYSLLDGYFIREYMLSDPTTGLGAVGSAGIYAESNVNGVGGFIGRVDGSGGITSVWRIGTGGGANQDALMYMNCNVDQLCLPGATYAPISYETRVQLSATTNTYFVVGFGVNGTGSPPSMNNSIYCDVTNGAGAGNWACHTRAGATQTDVTLSPVQTADGNWHVVKFIIGSSSVTFYFDGTAVGTSSSNVPTQYMNPEWEAKATTAVGVEMRVNGWIYEKKN